MCLGIVIALVQPSIGNALTFKKGEKKSFKDSEENSQTTPIMTNEEKKQYQKDKARAEQKKFFQYDLSEVAGDNSWGSFKSPFFTMN